MPCKLMTNDERIQAAEKAEGRTLNAGEKAALIATSTPTFRCTPGKGVQGLGKPRKPRKRGKK